MIRTFVNGRMAAVQGDDYENALAWLAERVATLKTETSVLDEFTNRGITL